MSKNDSMNESAIILKSESENSMLMSERDKPSRDDSLLLLEESDRSTRISSNVTEEISWKAEALKGNFMPAAVMLERGEIKIDEIVNPQTEDKLLHLAVSYSFYNVTRTFVELFNAPINIVNAYGHTPLHVICNSKSQDIYLLSYIIKNDFLQIDPVDKAGVTPLYYAAMSKFHIAFLGLIYLKADFGHIDNFGNSIFYMALTSDNKFALNFGLKHGEPYGISINGKYYHSTSTLADILITNKNSSCCKHIAKYFYNQIDNESLSSCQKMLEQFTFYNRFNYEILNTVYLYKTGSWKELIKRFIGFGCKKRSRVNSISIIPGTHEGDIDIDQANTSPADSLGNSRRYEFKWYNFIFLFYHLILPNTNRYIKTSLIAIYTFFLTFAFFYLYRYIAVNLINPPPLVSFHTFITLYHVSTIFSLLFSLYKIIAYVYPKDFYEENQYSLTNPMHQRENVCYQIYEALERNPLDTVFEEEICEICLIKKAKDTNHCHMCRKCVKEFYFHSNVFDVCFNRWNSYYYVLFLFSLYSMHFSVMYFYSIVVNIDNIQNESIYSSHYFITNVFIFVSNMKILPLFLCLLLIYTGILYLGRMLTLIICIGYRTSYYNMFRFHKKSIGQIEQRSNLYYNIPKMSLMSLKEFIRNLFSRN